MEAFHVDSQALDGRKSRCKECRSERPKIDGELVATAPDGMHVRKVSTLYDADGSIKQQWIKSDADEEDRRQAMLDAVRGLADEWPIVAAPKKEPRSDEDLLCCYLFGDPHFGAFAWHEETGDDWDLKLAEQYHLTAMEALVQSSPPAKHALIISIGDLFHADNSSNMTPRSGHILDVDSRRPKVARSVLRSLRRLGEIALQKHGSVEFWIVPGNHDPDSTTMAQLALSMFFEHESRVYVCTSPAIALYKRFGANLIGATHGHTVKKPELLGAIMAADQKQHWSDTEYRYWYKGHLHHDALVEAPGGVLIETIRTLAAPDKYAADNLYRSGRDAKCDVYHRSDGRIIRNTVGIQQIKRRLKQGGA